MWKFEQGKECSKFINTYRTIRPLNNKIKFHWGRGDAYPWIETEYDEKKLSLSENVEKPRSKKHADENWQQ